MLNKLSINLLATLACLLSITTSFAQDKRVSGKITDEGNNPLPGVSVSVKTQKRQPLQMRVVNSH